MVPFPGNCCLKSGNKDKISMDRNEEEEFIAGVVEGFYGRPWTFDQRKELFSRLKKLGLNFYLYAPKDDIKHRALWREMYTPDELDNLRSLISCAREQNIVFIYALSPGLDMVFSSSKEVDTLKNKIKQIADLGCVAFALLYDDIDPEIRPADKHAFESFAHAQVTVTNEVFKFLSKAKYFLVCPTEYAASRAVPTVDKSSYLSTLGSQLHPAIDIMWTGPKVVSKVITTHSIRVVANVLKRKPVIWDNIHANDYDQRRLFLGPYDGRPIHLYTHLRGILTNPNCEFESNFIAIHTLSTWIKCARVTFFGEEEASPRNTSNTKETKDIIEPMEDESVVDSNLSGNQSESKDLGVDSKEEKIDSTMDTDIEPTTSPVVIEPVLPKSITILKAYDPEEAVKLAVTEWLQEFSNPKSVIFNTYAKSGTFSVVNNSTPVQSTASIPTQTDVTSAILKDSVKVISAPSPVKVAKAKSRNKTKKDMEAEHVPAADSCVGEEMEVVETKTEIKDEVCQHKHELPFRLTVDDLLLLVDFFYLPHQHGKRAIQILNEFRWLKANSIKSDEMSDTESAKKVWTEFRS
ncbi:Hypothetical predicted protein [Paramuricea clavata]|uniref:protein O-GlcNAcase n=1 Tax=Paramuricea clavata TaxID=317549 RepID=A0A6S7L2G5_PARCT|nr:Hypothetical predicted protein [Paramuricea clavata]